jgi:hypothetical protein
MKMSEKFLLSCASALFLFSVTAFAQNSPSFTISGLVQLGGVGVPQGQRGAPYSATKETQTIQTLSDGTHITRKSHTRFYRDSQGRIRTELFLPVPPNSSTDEPMQILINDPVEGVTYSLNPRNHTGTRNDFRRMVPQQPPPKPPASTPPPQPPRQLLPKPTSEDLGMQMIDGLWARGRKMTMTIPVDTQGNDRPLVTVTETWFSEELQAEVLIKRSDPRNGDSTDRLTNIDRSEPDPSLFRPPADYTITEQQRQ